MSKVYTTQNELLLKNLLDYYKDEDTLNKMLSIINGESNISLRIVDWFVTNYAKKNFTVYNVNKNDTTIRFKVYCDYKLKLKAYSKKRFDPFCRWERINIPYNENTEIQTTIGQLNFFRWTLENKILDYIEKNFETINNDQQKRNSTSKKKKKEKDNIKTRKKREELSVSASKSIKKETVEIIVDFK
jgi:hypothetical protein